MYIPTTLSIFSQFRKKESILNNSEGIGNEFEERDGYGPDKTASITYISIYLSFDVPKNSALKFEHSMAFPN